MMLSSAVFGLDQDPEGYYEIKTGDDLFEFAQKVNRGKTTIKGKLMNDITIDEQVKINNNGELETAGSREWTPIGTEDNPFNGEFLAQKMYISGLYINSDNDNVGLFGVVGGNGKINDVKLINSCIKGRDNIGGIAGINRGTIDGCSVTRVKIEGNYSVGGNVGRNDNKGTISGTLINEGKISGNKDIGGNVGYNDNRGTISGTLTNKGEISGNEEVGGNVGFNWGEKISGTLTNEGKISGNEEVGGNVGLNWGEKISGNLINEGKISGNKDIGGNVGLNKVTISGTLTNEGKISGNESVGGNVGLNSSQITAEAKLTNKGKVTGTENSESIGGNVGDNVGTISGNLTNEGEISGNYDVGGNVGYNKGQITAETGLTNKGKVTGTENSKNIGGNVGRNWKGTISDTLTNEGEISGKEYVGGNVGFNAVQITAELTNKGKVIADGREIIKNNNIGHN